MPSFSKRKRNTRDMRCVSFPEDVRETFSRRGTCETPKAAKSSWQTCGDSFLDTPVVEVRDEQSTHGFSHAVSLPESAKNVFVVCFFFQKHDATRRTVQQLAQTSTSGKYPHAFSHMSKNSLDLLNCRVCVVRPGSGGEDPVHIAWTSSEDEDSDGEPQLPLAVTKAARRPRPTVSSASSRYARFLSTGADTDELPTIDSESEHEDISTSKEPISPAAAEISDYSSDSDGDPDTSWLDSPAQEPAEQRQRSVSEWVRAAQALLQTPPKQTDKPSKTPEDSGKKKRKFESRGLAERLNRLQCRQRSAISFWRHQPVSSITTGTEERPGVLVLHVQSVWEVCGTQAALCQRLPERQMCVVLFSKETAAQLAPGAGDTVHIHPPWQSLTVDGERHPIILNTHFSQKVSGATKQDTGATCSKVLCLTEKTKPYPLTRCFWKREENFQSSQASIPDKQTRRDAGTAFESLLEALEACGPSGSVCGPVEAVVQRIYFSSVAQFPHTSLLRHRTLSKHNSGTAPQRRVGRCCLLVQDVYGMFGEVEMQYASSEDELKDLTEQLQGRVCLLQGLKVIQRLTRERCAQLFSLIDSLWPPAVPLRVPGEGSCCQTVKVAAPSFCYRLTGQRDRVFPKGESPLYRPPLIQTLREILQDEPASRWCSFKATLVYKREQDKEGKDLLLFVTDSSLQQDEQDSGSVSRTVPVHANSVFLLRHAAAAPSPRFGSRLIFRDAVMEQGKIIVSGQTVVRLDSEPSRSLNISSPRSVLLDQLSPESPSCSLCTVTGVVTDVDENSAFSWPACGQCGGDGLEASEDKPDVFSCVVCGVVDKPSRKMQLEVFLSCPSSRPWTVKVKLQQNSIMSLLNSTGHAEGYEVEAVLGKNVGPLSAFIHVVTRSPSLWMGLEEITL
ncbi:DNA repair-scaffolding protein isoform X2 [Ictalurus furcatus]|uniref:DNA repair-scaffolding protein isoform X2 n=1 Tax=Ictalurus furcatus TaxID=66913 RepID=UPI002350D7F9|nr:DNA repair-scaffolding protein isoform X2 [Ictalurus furcatus]